MACSVCGGKYVMENLECLHCYGDGEGPGCDSDGCPAFGIATEDRCRCNPPSPNLPIIFFDQIHRTSKYRCDACGALLSQEGQLLARGRNSTLLLCDACNQGRGEFIDDINPPEAR